MKNEAATGNDGFSIVDEFKNLLPPLNPEDFEALEKSILNEGCRDALVVWEEKKILIEGHHRYAICEKHGLVYEIEEKSFKNREAVIEWMLNHQKSRRNMNRFQWAEVILKLKPTVEAKAKENQRAGGGAVRKKSAKPVHTLETLAKMAGISRPTLRQVAFILKNADQNTIRKLRNGNAGVSINGVYQELHELFDKKKSKRSGITKKKTVNKAAPKQTPQDTPPTPEQASHILTAFEEDIETKYPDLADRLEFYNKMAKWTSKQISDLAVQALSKKRK